MAKDKNKKIIFNTEVQGMKTKLVVEEGSPSVKQVIKGNKIITTKNK